MVLIMSAGIFLMLLLLNKKEDTEAETGVIEIATESDGEEVTVENFITTEETAPPDKTAPVIEGIHNITSREGDAIAYKAGITVTDDEDENPSLAVDASGVDITKPGKYTVIYTASDASGNTFSKEAEVEIVTRDAITKEQADAMADEILAAIITEGMSDYEKIRAVYDYVVDIGYINVNYGSIDDYLENAWYYNKNRVGDCRCSFALSKLLLERMGYGVMHIQNRADIHNVHHWELVSLDGKNWYHFDSMERDWIPKEYAVCMVTDAWLKDFYNKYKDRDFAWYDWDETVYPPTPEEEFPK